MLLPVLVLRERGERVHGVVLLEEGRGHEQVRVVVADVALVEPQRLLELRLEALGAALRDVDLGPLGHVHDQFGRADAEHRVGHKLAVDRERLARELLEGHDGLEARLLLAEGRDDAVHHDGLLVDVDGLEVAAQARVDDDADLVVDEGHEHVAHGRVLDGEVLHARRARLAVVLAEHVPHERLRAAEGAREGLDGEERHGGVREDDGAHAVRRRGARGDRVDAEDLGDVLALEADLPLGVARDAQAVVLDADARAELQSHLQLDHLVVVVQVLDEHVVGRDAQDVVLGVAAEVADQLDLRRGLGREVVVLELRRQHAGRQARREHAGIVRREPREEDAGGPLRLRSRRAVVAPAEVQLAPGVVEAGRAPPRRRRRPSLRDLRSLVVVRRSGRKRLHR